MQITIDIPKYDNKKGFKFNWENNFEIKTRIENGVIHITANKDGLLSLANHLLNLSQESIPSGYHFHLDQFNSLEEDSAELIIEKNN